MSLNENKAGGTSPDADDYNAVVDAVVALQAGGGGGSQTLEYIVTDYTVADVVAVGAFGAIGPVATLAPGDALLGASVEVTEIWDGVDVTLQLVNDPSGEGDLNQAYTVAQAGETVAPLDLGVIDFRVGSQVSGGGNSAVVMGFVPAAAPAVPLYVTTGQFFGDQGVTGALTVRLIIVRAA